MEGICFFSERSVFWYIDFAEFLRTTRDDSFFPSLMGERSVMVKRTIMTVAGMHVYELAVFVYIRMFLIGEKSIVILCNKNVSFN